MSLWIGGPATRDEDVHKAHIEGRLGFRSFYTASLSAARTVLLRTGARPLKLGIYVKTSALCTLEIKEGVTTTATGTLLTSQPFNRLLALDCLSAFYDTPTYSGGTSFKITASGLGSVPGQAQTGDASSQFFYELLPSTDYVLISTPATTLNYYIEVDFWET